MANAAPLHAPTAVALPYLPFDRQAAFHRCTAEEALYGGAAGPGKSLALLMEFLQQCLETEGIETILFRRIFPQLENTLIKWSLEGAPGPTRPGRFPIGRYNSSSHTWYFPNGSRLRFGHAQQENSIRIYQGQQFEGIGFDELTEWSEDPYRFAIRLLRSTNPAAWPRIRGATNPIGIGYQWVKDRFVQPYLEGLLPQDEPFKPDPTDEDPEPMSRAYIPATHRDNPVLTIADPGYIGRLKQLMSARDRVALLEGSWDLPGFEGALFMPDVIAAMTETARGFEPARWGCGKCRTDFYDPKWVTTSRAPDGSALEKVVHEGDHEWAREVVYSARPRCAFCSGPLVCRNYLTAWDLARKLDWTVGITVDITEPPGQVVAFERFRRTPWPVVAERIERRWALYPGQTLIDSSGVGDPVMQFLHVPVEGVLFSGKSKPDMVQALILLLEAGGLKAPLRGEGIDQMYRELAAYQWDDKKIVQDCVMALAMLAMRLPRYGDSGITI